MSSTEELLERLIAVHDWSEDEAGLGMGTTSLGAQACRHWADWGDLLERGPHSAAGDDAPLPTDRSLAIALGLLPFTGTPASWVALARSIPALPTALRGQAVRTLVAALNVRFAELLGSDEMTRDRAIQLAHIFETINLLDDWCISVDADYNYIPQFGIQHWFDAYLTVVNVHCSAEDLHLLTERTEDDISITEALSVVTESDRLHAVATASPDLGAIVAQAPNLSAAFVNEHISQSQYLIFHPKADLELAWSTLEELLSTSPDDVIQLMAPMDNLRDQGWGVLMGYPQSGANVDSLRARTRQWCIDNPEDGEDLLLEIFDG